MGTRKGPKISQQHPLATLQLTMDLESVRRRMGQLCLHLTPIGDGKLMIEMNKTRYLMCGVPQWILIFLIVVLKIPK